MSPSPAPAAAPLVRAALPTPLASATAPRPRPPAPSAPVALRVARRLADRSADPSGQATAEYALVLLGVAAVALLLAAWATKSGAIGQLFEAVLHQLIGRVR